MRNYCEDLMYADWPKWSNLGGKISTVVSIVSGFVGCLIGTAIGICVYTIFITVSVCGSEAAHPSSSKLMLKPTARPGQQANKDKDDEANQPNLTLTLIHTHQPFSVRLRVLRVAADLRVHRAVPTPELQADGRGQPVQLQQWLDPRRVPHRAVHPHVHRQQHLHPSRHPLGPHGPHVLGQVLPGSLGEDRDGGLQQHGGPAEPGGAGQQQVRHVLERRARGEAIAWGGVRAGAVSDHQPRTLNPES
mmetsp:Transcript_38673/g.121138  ORF Transcript_38673/g.121138 Transcript_38673/m.121138 type:complete len:247 (+) Transcript_38673:116-856(+)